MNLKTEFCLVTGGRLHRCCMNSAHWSPEAMGQVNEKLCSADISSLWERGIILAFLFNIYTDFKVCGNNSLSASLNKIRKLRQIAIIRFAWSHSLSDSQSVEGGVFCTHSSSRRHHALTQTPIPRNIPRQGYLVVLRLAESSSSKGKYKSNPAFGSKHHWDKPRPKDEKMLWSTLFLPCVRSVQSSWESSCISWGPFEWVIII